MHSHRKMATKWRSSIAQSAAVVWDGTEVDGVDVGCEVVSEVKEQLQYFGRPARVHTLYQFLGTNCRHRETDRLCRCGVVRSVSSSVVVP
jgi:hypothetical protein